MLLYHFPLTSSSVTANLTNKGIKQDYLLRNNVVFETGGKLSSYALRTKANNDGLQIEIPTFTTDYTLCLRINISSNQYLCEINNEQIVSSYVGITNSWCDVVIMKNKLYVDKVYKRDLTYSNGKLLIGGLFSNGGTCNCLIQDIRIYDHALSQAEINEYSRALVVHYPLQGNELNGSVLKDVSGFGNDMQRYGGSSSYDNNSPRADKSLHLVNANHCYYQGNMKWSDYKQFTISAWVYPTNNSNYRGVIGQHGGTPNGGVVFAQWKSGNIYFSIAGAVSSSISDTPQLSNWVYYCLVYDGTDILLYKNGIFYDKRTLTGTPNLDKYVWLGRSYNTNDRYWDGNISDVRIYATALSAEDIKNLYNSPISVSNQHQTMAFEFKENPLYPSKYWRTPTYAEMNYILNSRTNAANLRTLGRVEISSGVFINGLFLLPDNWVLPQDVSMTITTANYTTNTYSLLGFETLENAGAVFFPASGLRQGVTVAGVNVQGNYSFSLCRIQFAKGVVSLYTDYVNFLYRGQSIRLCKNGSQFSTSATTKIDFAQANIQYHCTQHIWRFAQKQYDFIGSANANISDSYDGWIDFFGYGTSGVNYSPTLHSSNNADYASGGIANTDNDWGINEIQSYDYNVKNFAANKNGIVQHNELKENDSEVNGCYKDKILTNELIEN